MFKFLFLSTLIIFVSSASTFKFRNMEEVVLMASGNSAYLKATKNCHVGNDKIKKQAESLIKDAKTNRQKAEKIFQFVRDKIEYQYYMNTRYGSLRTLQRKKANCVDQTHLLNALLRTAGIPARYKNGIVRFVKSGYMGHVWSYANIDGKWKDLDTTSKMNTFDKIKNWNHAKSFELLTSINF